MSHNSPSIGDLIIAMLGSARSTRQFHTILRERQFKRYREESVRVALSRLHTRGYINNSAAGWATTQKGQKKAQKINLLSYIPSPFKEKQSAQIIIAFDIPEKDRIIRRWLRNQIKIFGYKMLQQSLWIGPGSLPLSFMKRLGDLKIRKNVKTFKITQNKN